MSAKTHLKHHNGKSACGIGRVRYRYTADGPKPQAVRLDFAELPNDVTCTNCQATWAWAVAMGCADESKR